MALERRGVPAVVVGTEAFASLARTASAAEGMPQLAHFTVAHPIGGLDPSVVRGRAAALVDDILAALTRDRVLAMPVWVSRSELGRA